MFTSTENCFFKEQLWAKWDFHSFSFPPGWNPWNWIEPVSSQWERNKHCSELVGSHWGFSWAMGQLSETVMWWRSWCCHWREAGLSQRSGRCITGDEGLEVVGGHLLELLRTYREKRWGRPWPLVSSYRAHWVLQNYWGTSEVWRMADHLFFCLPRQGGTNEG